jgi:hypothetical protein
MGTHSLLADVNIPFVFGLPQIIILLIGLCGLGLLVWVVLGVTRGKPDKDGVRRRRFFWGRAISGSIMLLLAISLLYLALILQTYLGLTNNILVAHVSATRLTNVNHYMIVDLTLFNEHGDKLSEQSYGVCGDEWMLQADILRLPDWLNILGVHSGYKLTRLEGRYDDPNLERHAEHTVVVLNGGDDNFFTGARPGGWLSWFAQAQYGSSAFTGPGSYNVFVSQDALNIQTASTLAPAPGSRSSLVMPLAAAQPACNT